MGLVRIGASADRALESGWFGAAAIAARSKATGELRVAA
jgi:hypothetical protein